MTSRAIFHGLGDPVSDRAVDHPVEVIHVLENEGQVQQLGLRNESRYAGGAVDVERHRAEIHELRHLLLGAELFGRKHLDIDRPCGARFQYFLELQKPVVEGMTLKSVVSRLQDDIRGIGP